MAYQLEPVTTTEELRSEPRGWVRRPKRAQAMALRARIVLAATEARTNTEIADELDVSRQTVGKWRRPFAEMGLEGLVDVPRPGAPRQVGDEDVERVIAMTLEGTPAKASNGPRVRWMKRPC